MSYKTECLNCGGSNFYITPNNGKGYCFNCGYFVQDGNVKPEPKKRSPHIKEIREYYKRMTYYYHSCLDEDKTSYLISRGYEINDIEQLMIGYAPREKGIMYNDAIATESGLANYDKEAFLGGRIVFPYLKGNEVWDMRGRVYDVEDDRKYLSPIGTTYFRGADMPYNIDAIKDAETIVITEGEVKTGISNKIIPTIGLPGILAWRSGYVPKGEQKKIICYDNQIDNRRDVVQAIKRTARHFDTAELYVATLPLEENDKMDIDSYILEYGAARYLKVLDRALPFDYWNKLVRY